MMRPPDKSAFADLNQELTEYWKATDSAVARRPGPNGYAFSATKFIPAALKPSPSWTASPPSANTTSIRASFRSPSSSPAFANESPSPCWSLSELALLSPSSPVAESSSMSATRRRIFATSSRPRSELKELSTRLVDAQESERRAISRELHDEVGQSLSALLVSLGNAVAESEAAPSPRLAESRHLAEASLRCVRNIALLLRPSMLDDLGLLPALQWQAREVSKRSGMSVTVDADGVPEELPDDYRTAIYRVVQEALHNSEQHAGATMARITKRVHAGALALSIQDNGHGFDPESTRGMGILGMQERVANLGGVFHIETESHGALVTVRLPLPS